MEWGRTIFDQAVNLRVPRYRKAIERINTPWAWSQNVASRRPRQTLERAAVSLDVSCQDIGLNLTLVVVFGTAFFGLDFRRPARIAWLLMELVTFFCLSSPSEDTAINLYCGISSHHCALFQRRDLVVASNGDRTYDGEEATISTDT